VREKVTYSYNNSPGLATNAKVIPPTKPTYFMSIWPTDGCFRCKDNTPFRCRYCFYEASALRSEYKPPRMMTLETADLVADVLNEGWISGVSFFGGEPLCNWPVIERILQKSNEMVIRNVTNKMFGSVYNITTNGVHLNKERLKILAASNVHINLSFDGTKETQDKWRDGSYDEVVHNIELLIKYPSLTVTKTNADPTTFYDDIKHIKELGFKYVFTNFLDPYGAFTYDGYDLEAFVSDYKRAVKDFHNKDGFQMGEINAWKELHENNLRGKMWIGCGFIGTGLGVGPDGYYYQCHQGPTLPDSFRIGHLSTGINKEKEKILRSVQPAPTCASCVYKRNKCFVNMYHKHGRFGVDPPEVGMRWERRMIEVMAEINDLPLLRDFACLTPFEKTLQEIIDKTTVKSP